MLWSLNSYATKIYYAIREVKDYFLRSSIFAPSEKELESVIRDPLRIRLRAGVPNFF